MSLSQAVWKRIYIGHFMSTGPVGLSTFYTCTASYIHAAAVGIIEWFLYVRSNQTMCIVYDVDVSKSINKTPPTLNNFHSINQYNTGSRHVDQEGRGQHCSSHPLRRLW